MIKVLKAGILTTIQDQGRFGFAAFGVPVSGVMDNKAANLANSILNNKLEEALIEITFGYAEFQFLISTEIAICGADFTPELNHVKIPLNTKIYIQKNDVISFGKTKYGVRAYLAVKSGIKSEKVLKSRSFYKNITSKYQLRKGDIIPIKTFSSINTNTFTSVKINLDYIKKEKLTCFKGPEFDLLSEQNKQLICKQKFTISKENSRMGYRLNEPLNNTIPQILTSAVLPGTVQLTPSGVLIILMKDCQVTGGYPRVLQLSEQAICSLAQKSTNDIIQFNLIN
ncbi:MAG: biotin-dependent carboxyltransferase family protein [Flavobacteriaceae bacterium]|nr:biotin-dependent carboxyltransferase family protein [Flavobacteriaceae bacterium]